MTEATGYRYAKAHAMQRFSNTPEYHQMDTATVAAKLDVAMSTIGRWRKDLGIVYKTRAQRALEKLYKDPDFGLDDGLAKTTDQALADRYGLGQSTVVIHRLNNGIACAGAPVRFKKGKIAKLFESWQRPKGIQEHLDALADN